MRNLQARQVGLGTVEERVAQGIRRAAEGEEEQTHRKFPLVEKPLATEGNGGVIWIATLGNRHF